MSRGAAQPRRFFRFSCQEGSYQQIINPILSSAPPNLSTIVKNDPFFLTRTRSMEYQWTICGRLRENKNKSTGRRAGLVVLRPAMAVPNSLVQIHPGDAGIGPSNPRRKTKEATQPKKDPGAPNRQAEQSLRVCVVVVASKYWWRCQELCAMWCTLQGYSRHTQLPDPVSLARAFRRMTRKTITTKTLHNPACTAAGVSGELKPPRLCTAV